MFRFRAAASLTATALMAGTLLAAPVPAFANFGPVDTGDRLAAAIELANTTPGAEVITITGDIEGVDLTRVVTDELTIEVSGFTVSSVRLLTTSALTLRGEGTWVAGTDGAAERSLAPGIGVAPGASFTVDSLTLDAVGTACDAGIGGWEIVGGGTTVGECVVDESSTAAHGAITIIDSTVSAKGGAYSAGIGSAMFAPSALVPGVITFVRSVIVAEGGTFAAGVGGGWGADAGVIDISGGVLEARGNNEGSGIGGGLNGSAGSVVLRDGAVVEAVGAGDSGVGIGAGLTVELPLPPGDIDGTLEVLDGTLRDTRVFAPTTVPAGGTLAIDGTVSVLRPIINDGVISITGGAGALESTGPITNRGVIRPSAGVTADLILGNNVTVTYDPNAESLVSSSVRYLAPDIASAAEALPTPPRPGFVVREWNTAPDGSGATLTANSSLATVGGNQAAFTVYAMWDVVSLEIDGAASVVAGGTVDFVVTRSDDFGGVETVTDAVLTSSEPTDVIDGDSVTASGAGERTITATIDGLEAETVLLVEAAPVAELTLAAPSLTVDVGGSLTFEVDGADAFGNPVAVDPGDVVLASDVATDVIDGLTVTFPTASPHVITATVGEVSTSVTVTVQAAAVEPPAPAPILSATGPVDVGGPALAALLLALLGVVLIGASRRRA